MNKHSFILLFVLLLVQVSQELFGTNIGTLLRGQEKLDERQCLLLPYSGVIEVATKLHHRRRTGVEMGVVARRALFLVVVGLVISRL